MAARSSPSRKDPSSHSSPLTLSKRNSEVSGFRSPSLDNLLCQVATKLEKKIKPNNLPSICESPPRRKRSSNEGSKHIYIQSTLGKKDRRKYKATIKSVEKALGGSGVPKTENAQGTEQNYILHGMVRDLRPLISPPTERNASQKKSSARWARFITASKTIRAMKAGAFSRDMSLPATPGKNQDRLSNCSISSTSSVPDSFGTASAPSSRRSSRRSSTLFRERRVSVVRKSHLFHVRKASKLYRTRRFSLTPSLLEESVHRIVDEEPVKKNSIGGDKPEVVVPSFQRIYSDSDKQIITEKIVPVAKDPAKLAAVCKTRRQSRIRSKSFSSDNLYQLKHTPSRKRAITVGIDKLPMKCNPQDYLDVQKKSSRLSQQAFSLSNTISSTPVSATKAVERDLLRQNAEVHIVANAAHEQIKTFMPQHASLTVIKDLVKKYITEEWNETDCSSMQIGNLLKNEQNIALKFDLLDFEETGCIRAGDIIADMMNFTDSRECAFTEEEATELLEGVDKDFLFTKEDFQCLCEKGLYGHVSWKQPKSKQSRTPPPNEFDFINSPSFSAFTPSPAAHKKSFADMF